MPEKLTTLPPEPKIEAVPERLEAEAEIPTCPPGTVLAWSAARGYYCRKEPAPAIGEVPPPELLPEVVEPPEIPVPIPPVVPPTELELPELFQRVYPEFDFGTETGEVVLSTMMQWAEEDPNAFLEDIYGRGKTPETEALLRALGAEEPEIEEFFAPVPITPIEELITNIWPDTNLENFVAFVEEDWEGFVTALQIGGRTKDKQDLLKMMGFSWEEIGEVFKTQKVVMDIEGIRKLVTLQPSLTGRETIVLDEKGREIGTVNPATLEFEPYKYRIGDTWKSFSAGTGDVIVTAGGAFKWLGADEIGERLSEFGEYLQLQAPPDTLGEFDWQMLYNPRFYSERVVRTLPFTMALVPAWIAGSTAGAWVAGAIGVSRFWTFVLQVTGAATLSRPIESALEAGGTYDAAIDKGMSPEKAREAATEVFVNNLKLVGLDAAQLAVAFAPAPARVFESLIIKGLVTTARIAGRVTITGLSEAGEEYYQEIIQRQALGEEIVWDAEMKEVVAIGGIMGLGLGVGGDVFTTIQRKTKEALTPEQRAIPLDELIADPEVQQIVRDVIENVRIDELEKEIKPKTDVEKLVWERTFEQMREEAPTVPVIPEVVPEVIPPVVKVPIPPEIPEVIGEGGIPVPPEEPIPQGVIDNNPTIQDIGAKEFVRPTRKVFERMGLYEDYKGIQRAEVEIGEEREARRKAHRKIMESVGKDKDRWSLIFDEVNEKGSVVGLTFNEKRAVTYIRNWANEWAEKKNLPKEKRIKDYIPHLFEQEMIAQLKETGKMPPELANILSEKVAKHITDPFLKERLGAVGFLKDPFRAMEAYDAASLRVLYYEPFLQKIATIANDPAQPRAVRDYLKDYSRRMTGEPSKLDMKINADIQEFASKLSKLPGGAQLASYMERGNVSGLVAYNFTSAIYTLWLGFKATSAIRNLSQHTLIIGEVGPVHFANAIRMRFTKEGKAALKKSLVLRSRKAAFVPGIDDSFAEKWVDKFRETALWMFRMADKQNVSDAFLAGYSEAKSLLPKADEQVWIDRGDEVAADTQYLYTKMNSMAISQSSVGRVFSILTTWSENWIELMSKWIARRPSQVYLEHERVTGEKVAGAAWSTSYKAILIYMVIIGLGFAIKERTRLKAWEYTGLTSIRYLADVVGGDFPGLQAPGAIANMVAGFITDDDRMFKEGWNGAKSTFTPGIIRQLDAVLDGDKDWMTLLLYLEGKDWKIKQLKNRWEKDFEEYPIFETNEERLEYFRTHPKQAGWSDAKIRDQWREDNPKLEAKMFIVNQFSTLSTDEARAEVLRLIEKHDLDTEMIDGYEKVFGIDTAVELDKFQNRVGNLEKLVAGEEAEYFTVGNFVTEVNKAVKTQGRVKVEKDGNLFAIEVLRAQDSFVQYDSLEEADARKLFRQQFPDVEALMYLMGKVSSFVNPKSSDILLGLMEKYDIPPEGIRAFIDKPERYDELFTPIYELRKKWYDLITEYDNYSNAESPLYIEDEELRKDAREKLKVDNPNWMADMRRIEAIQHDATDAIVEKWAERGKVIDEFEAGSSEAMVWLVDNPEAHKWALEQKLLTDDGSDWNVPVLRINAEWRDMDNQYQDILDKFEDVKKQTEATKNFLIANPEYARARRMRDAYSIGVPDDQVDAYVKYYELPQAGYRRERYLKENIEIYRTFLKFEIVQPMDFSKIPDEQYDVITERWTELFDQYEDIRGTPEYRREFREKLFADNPKFHMDFLRRRAHSNFYPEDQIENYAKYYSLPEKGVEQELFLLEHPDFAKVAKKIEEWDKLPDKNIESYRISVKFDKEDARYSGMGEPSSEFYIEDRDKRNEARELLLKQNEAYATARRRRDAFDQGFPENLIPKYVEYYLLPEEGYAKERYLKENKDFYDVAKRLLEWSAVDFTKVPSLEVERLYEIYRELDNPRDKMNYRVKNRELDDWLVKTKGYKPALEQVDLTLVSKEDIIYALTRLSVMSDEERARIEAMSKEDILDALPDSMVAKIQAFINRGSLTAAEKKALARMEKSKESREEFEKLLEELERKLGRLTK